MEQRVCAICGAIFNVTHHNRKYCDKCRIHPEQKRQQIEWAYENSKRRMAEPKIIEVECELCHKKIKTTKKLLFKFEDRENTEHRFCSRKCLDTAHEKYNKEQVWPHIVPSMCLCCGKSLTDSDFFNGVDQKTAFCSKECHDKYMGIHICENCGKEFKRDGEAHFCSKECHIEAQKKKKQKRLASFITKECEYCKKPFSAPSDSDKHFCSKECYMAAIKGGWKSERTLRWQANIKKNQEQRQQEREKAKRERKEKIQAERYKPHKLEEGEQLCATCNVSYKDCERMQTNFRVLPKGAHYNDKGVLTVCPKYKPYNKKAQERIG